MNFKEFLTSQKKVGELWEMIHKYRKENGIRSTVLVSDAFRYRNIYEEFVNPVIEEKEVKRPHPQSVSVVLFVSGNKAKICVNGKEYPVVGDIEELKEVIWAESCFWNRTEAKECDDCGAMSYSILTEISKKKIHKLIGYV